MDGESAAQEGLSAFAEAAQDLVTAGLEQALGRNYACADACNQVAEKVLQAVHLVRSGRRAAYNHDLVALGAALAVPDDVAAGLANLSRYYPETFYAHTAPNLADDAVSAEEVTVCMGQARLALRWARGIVMAA
ncbi:MAG: HEPN domain-containing protein [Ktedonobacterales bacterium]|nr:HEPN domain-containing protein [Ktedonobacterales bacterium]